MRTRTLTLSLLAVTALALTSCSSSSSHDTAGPATPTAGKTTAAQKADCNDPSLSQADWMAHCSGNAGSPGGGLNKQFGQTYAWPDGIKVTVTQARVFTHYDKSLGERPTSGSTDFRLSIRITNGSSQPLDLSTLSTITDGAVNGGEASITSWSDEGSPLEGRLAPGVTAVKTDDGTLATKYGRKIVVSVQRTAPGSIQLMRTPEFTGSITG